MQLRAIGPTNLQLTSMGLGAAPLGQTFRSIGSQDAADVLQAAWDGGIRYFDTSPWYGLGLSEHRVGQFLRDKPRNDFVISTKVGRLLKPPRGGRKSPWAGGLSYDYHFDYSYEGVMRSFEDSLQRLSLDHVDILYIHDLDAPNLGSETAVSAHLGALVTGGFRALEELRRAGDISAFGAGVNERGMVPRIAEHSKLDVVLYALRYSLAEHDSLADDMAYCLDNDIAVVPGGVYSSGLYAAGPVPGITYNYRPATEDELARASRIQSVCRTHGVDLAAAAVQFPLHHPAVVSVVVGADSADQVNSNLASLDAPVPDELWFDLKREGLINSDAPTPSLSRNHHDG